MISHIDFKPIFRLTRGFCETSRILTLQGGCAPVGSGVGSPVDSPLGYPPGYPVGYPLGYPVDYPLGYL
jgi:hypothetical protein